MNSAPLDFASQGGEPGVGGRKAPIQHCGREHGRWDRLESKQTNQKQDCMKSFEMVFVFLTTSGGDSRGTDGRCGEMRFMPRVLTGRSSRT